MKISLSLSVYLTKHFLFWFLVFLCAVLLLVFLFDFSELLRRASSRPHVSLGLVAQMVLLRLLHLGEQLLPFVVLFSSMFALWRLNRHNEIMVARAAGLSVWQILTPFLVAALFIGSVDLLIINPVSSTFMARFNQLNNKHFLGKTSQLSVVESGLWFRHSQEGKKYVFHTGSVDPDQLHLKDIMLLEYGHNNQLINRIDARAGKFESRGLYLEDVWAFPVNGMPQKHSSYLYQTNLSLEQLQSSLLSTDVLSFWKLPKMIELMQGSGLSGHKYQLYWHTLIARALWLVTMILLAATCSLRPVRQGGTVLLIFLGTTIGFLLYFLKDVTYAMGQSSVLPTVLAAWGPFALSTFMGTAILLHLEDG